MKIVANLTELFDALGSTNSSATSARQGSSSRPGNTPASLLMRRWFRIFYELRRLDRDSTKQEVTQHGLVFDFDDQV
jgi:hypothetical protein